MISERQIGGVTLDVSWPQILVGGNLTLWCVSVSLGFYYLFVMGNKNEEDKKKRGLYAWGIKRFLFCMIWFTIGSGFILMSLNDWSLFIDFVESNKTFIIGGLFWSGFVFFIVYFFKHRLPKERKTRGLDNGSATPAVKIEEGTNK